jgi:hypothetical protein
MENKIMQLQNTAEITIDSSVWVIGTNEAHKALSVCRLIQQIKPEPSSEIFVLDPDNCHHEFYGHADIPIAHDISQIAQILNNLIQEFRDRQAGKIGTQIICVVEIDSLQAALKQRADQLQVAYEPQELATIVEILQDSDCAKLGIYIVFSVESTEGLLDEGNFLQMYCGEVAVSFASGLDDHSYDEICQQQYPCYFYVDGVIHPVSDTTKGNILSLEQIYRKEYICRNLRVLDLMGDRPISINKQKTKINPQVQSGFGIFQKLRNFTGGRS